MNVERMCVLAMILVLSSADVLRADVAPAVVGIVGAVKNQGAFEVPDSHLPLLALMNQVGVLAGADRSVRIVRNGKAGQQVYVTRATNFTLRSGDLLVVPTQTSKGARAHTPKPWHSDSGQNSPPWQAQNASAKDPSDQQMVVVALVEIAPYPVIFEIPESQATPAGIQSVLDQSQQKQFRLKIILNGGRPITEEVITKETKLSSPVVVTVPDKDIDFSRLPDFPKPVRLIEEEEANSNHPPLDVGANDQPQETVKGNEDQVPDRVDQEANPGSSRRKQGPSPRREDLPSTPENPSEEELGPGIEVPEPMPQGIPAPPETESPLSHRIVQRPQKSPVVRNTPSSDEAEELGPDLVGVVSNESQQSSTPYYVAVALFASGILIWYGYQKWTIWPASQRRTSSKHTHIDQGEHSPRKPHKQTRSQQSEPRTTWLDDLLLARVEVVEVPIEWPTEWDLEGRLPAEKLHYLDEPAQTTVPPPHSKPSKGDPKRPHFMEQQNVPGKGNQEHVPVRGGQEQPSGKGNKPHGLLDRVLIQVQRAQP